MRGAERYVPVHLELVLLQVRKSRPNNQTTKGVANKRYFGEVVSDWEGLFNHEVNFLGEFEPHFRDTALSALFVDFGTQELCMRVINRYDCLEDGHVKGRTHEAVTKHEQMRSFLLLVLEVTIYLGVEGTQWLRQLFRI